MIGPHLDRIAVFVARKGLLDISSNRQSRALINTMTCEFIGKNDDERCTIFKLVDPFDVWRACTGKKHDCSSKSGSKATTDHRTVVPRGVPSHKVAGRQCQADRRADQTSELLLPRYRNRPNCSQTRDHKKGAKIGVMVVFGKERKTAHGVVEAAPNNSLGAEVFASQYGRRRCASTCLRCGLRHLQLPPPKRSSLSQ